MPGPPDSHDASGAEPHLVRWTSGAAAPPQPSPAVRAALRAATSRPAGLDPCGAAGRSSSQSLTGAGRARLLLGAADAQGLRRPGGSTLVTAHWPADGGRRGAASSWTAGRALQVGTRLAATGLVLGPTLLAPAVVMADGAALAPPAPAPVAAAATSAPPPASSPTTAPPPSAAAPAPVPAAAAAPVSSVSTAPPPPAVSMAPAVTHQSAQASGPAIAVAVPLRTSAGPGHQPSARAPRHPRLGTQPATAPPRHPAHAPAPSTLGSRTSSGSGAPSGSSSALLPGAPGAPSGLPPAPQVAADLGTPSPLSSAVTNAAFGSLRLSLFLLPIYQAAGDQYGIPWQVLAAINEVETNYGFDDRTSSAGAVGWMQFMPATWQGYGVDAAGSHQANPFNPADAIFAAARYLKAAGGQTDLPGAVFAYNHSSDYVSSVMLRAKLFGSFPEAMINALSSLSVGRPPVPLNEAEQASLAVPDAAAGAAVTPVVRSPALAPPVPKAPPSIDLLPGSARARALATPPTARPPAARPAGNGGALAPGGRELHTVAGSRVLAVRDGRVVRVGRARQLGTYVTMADAEGNLFTYSHLARVGTPPVAGARTAPTGSSTGRPAVAGRPVSAATRAPVAPAVSSASPFSGRALRLLAFAPPPSRPLPPRGQRATTVRPRPAAAGAWQELHRGQTLAEGAVLGQVADTHGVGLLRFSIRPAGDSHSVDPSPYLTAWVLRQKTLDPAAATAAARAFSGPTQAGASASDAVTAASAATTSQPAAPVARPAAATATSPLLTGATAPAAPLPAAPNPPAATATSPSPAAAPNPLLRPVTPYAGASAIRTWGDERMFFESKATLSRTVLMDRRIAIYPCGRDDIAAQRIDARVLAVLEYLADSGLHPSVSTLQCGAHAAGGSVSELAAGTAVDISAVDGVSITGRQGSDTISAMTVQRLLALPVGFIPHDIISGMTFSQATNTLSPPDHANHIRVGFRPRAVAASLPSPTAHTASAVSALSTTLDAHQWKELTLHLEGLGAPPLLLPGASAARERQPAR